MATVPTPRPACQLGSGNSSRWFTYPVLPCAQFPSGVAGALTICTAGVSDALYDVVANSNWFDPRHPSKPLVIHGWRVLPRQRGAHVYDVCFEPGQELCYCQDGTYRPHRPCNRWRALKAALEDAGLTLHGVANARPSADEVRKALAGVPNQWWHVRTGQQPDGGWILLGSYHWDLSCCAEAATADELIAKMQQAEAGRVAKKADEAAAPPPPPPPTSDRLYLEPVHGDRRQRQNVRTWSDVLGFVVREPGEDCWRVIARQRGRRCYAEVQVGTVAHPQDALVILTPKPVPIIPLGLGKPLSTHWTGD